MTISGRAAARAALLGCSIAAAAASARAEDQIKIGMLVPYSGQFADLGEQIDRGADLWVRQHGDTVAGKKIVVLKRDATGLDPSQTKRLVQELITRDHVDFLTGFGMTPDALAAAPLGTEAKIPMVIMNASTGIITQKSPYFVRDSFTTTQIETPLGQWAARNGIHKVYIAISDYAPGLEAGAAFRKAFTEAGGEIVGEVRVPVQDLEMAPYVQRIKDAAPQSVFLFMPTGQLPLNFVRQFVQLGLKDAGIQLLGASEIIDDTVIGTLGDATLGIVSTQIYSYAHQSPLNTEFIKDYEGAFGLHPRANFLSVGGYDGMHAIYAVLQQLGGVMESEKAMAAFKGLKLDSPRGPLEIDPATRDPIETVYIRRVERVNGDIVNKEIAEFPHIHADGSD